MSELSLTDTPAMDEPLTLTLGDEDQELRRRREYDAKLGRARPIEVRRLREGDTLEILTPYARFARVLLKRGDRVKVECQTLLGANWMEIWGPAVRPEIRDKRNRVIQELKELGFDSVIEDGRGEVHREQSDSRWRTMQYVPMDQTWQEMLDAVQTATHQIRESLRRDRAKRSQTLEEAAAIATGEGADEGDVREQPGSGEEAASDDRQESPEAPRMTIGRAKKLAAEAGIDVSDIEGPGAMQRILERLQ